MRFQCIVWRSVLSFNNRYIHKTNQQKHLHRRKNYNSVLTFNPAEFNQIRARDKVNFKKKTPKKHVTSMSYKLKPAIWSRDMDQRIPCFDRCQLTIKWMSNIREVRVRGACLCQAAIWIMAAMLRDSVVVVRKRPRAIPLVMKTMRKSTHGFPFCFPHAAREEKCCLLFSISINLP